MAHNTSLKSFVVVVEDSGTYSAWGEEEEGEKEDNEREEEDDNQREDDEGKQFGKMRCGEPFGVGEGGGVIGEGRKAEKEKDEDGVEDLAPNDGDEVLLLKRKRKKIILTVVGEKYFRDDDLCWL